MAILASCASSLVTLRLHLARDSVTVHLAQTLSSIHLPALRQLTIEWDAPTHDPLIAFFTRHASQLDALTVLKVPYAAHAAVVSQRLVNLTALTWSDPYLHFPGQRLLDNCPRLTALHSAFVPDVWPVPALRHVTLGYYSVAKLATLNLADFPHLSGIALPQIPEDNVALIPRACAELVTECALFTTPPELRLLASMPRLCKLRLHCAQDSPPLPPLSLPLLTELTLTVAAVGERLLAQSASVLRQLLPCAPRLSIVSLVPLDGHLTAAEEALILDLVRELDGAAVSHLVVCCYDKPFARLKAAIAATPLCWLCVSRHD